MWSKLCRNVRAHEFRLKMFGASQYKPKSVEMHVTYILMEECVCGSMSNVDRTRTHAAVSAVAAAEQQPEGWRFVPDTILLGYQWAPQWVPARTPTVHWGPNQREGRGWPEHSSTQQYRAETRQTLQVQISSRPDFFELDLDFIGINSVMISVIMVCSQGLR